MNFSNNYCSNFEQKPQDLSTNLQTPQEQDNSPIYNHKLTSIPSKPYKQYSSEVQSPMIMENASIPETILTSSSQNIQQDQFVDNQSNFKKQFLEFEKIKDLHLGSGDNISGSKSISQIDSIDQNIPDYMKMFNDKCKKSVKKLHQKNNSKTFSNYPESVSNMSSDVKSQLYSKEQQLYEIQQKKEMLISERSKIEREQQENISQHIQIFSQQSQRNSVVPQSDKSDQSAKIDYKIAVLENQIFQSQFGQKMASQRGFVSGQSSNNQSLISTPAQMASPMAHPTSIETTDQLYVMPNTTFQKTNQGRENSFENFLKSKKNQQCSQQLQISKFDKSSLDQDSVGMKLNSQTKEMTKIIKKETKIISNLKIPQCGNEGDKIEQKLNSYTYKSKLDSNKLNSPDLATVMAESAAVANKILREELSFERKPPLLKKEIPGHRLYNLANEMNIKKQALIEEKKQKIIAGEDKILELQKKISPKIVILKATILQIRKISRCFIFQPSYESGGQTS